MGGMCCGPKVEYIGTIFYKIIDTKMEMTGKAELDEVFDKADDALQESEKTRLKIANAFKQMTISTGTVVLKNPDLEQCIRAYLIKFIMEVKLNARTKDGSNVVADIDFDKLELNKLFSFLQEKPYIKLDEDKLKNLKEVLNFNPLAGELGKMREDIVRFIKSLEGIKSVFDEVVKEAQEIRAEAYEFITKLKLSDGANELMKNLQIGKRNLQKIIDMTTIVKIIGEASRQISESVQVFGNLCTDSKEFKKYEGLADEMNLKRITDMKQIVWETTNEQRLDKFEQWETNFDYKLVNQVPA